MRILLATAIVFFCWLGAQALPVGLESLNEPAIQIGVGRDSAVLFSFRDPVRGDVPGVSLRTLPRVYTEEPLAAHSRVGALGFSQGPGSRAASVLISWVWTLNENWGAYWVARMLRWELSQGRRVMLAAPAFRNSAARVADPRAHTFSILASPSFPEAWTARESASAPIIFKLPGALIQSRETFVFRVSSSELFFTDAISLATPFGISGGLEVKSDFAVNSSGSAIFYPTRFGMLWAYCAFRPGGGEACTNRVDSLLRGSERANFLKLKKAIQESGRDGPNDSSQVLATLSALNRGSNAPISFASLRRDYPDGPTWDRLSSEWVGRCAQDPRPNQDWRDSLRELVLVAGRTHDFSEPGFAPQLSVCASKLGDREMAWHAEFLLNRVQNRLLRYVSPQVFFDRLLGSSTSLPDVPVPANNWIVEWRAMNEQWRLAEWQDLAQSRILGFPAHRPSERARLALLWALSVRSSHFEDVHSREFEARVMGSLGENEAAWLRARLDELSYSTLTFRAPLSE